jgi:hypothetical protein
MNIPISVPFPHSPETYIESLKEQKQFWSDLARPVKDIARPFLLDVLEDEHQIEAAEETNGSNGHDGITSVKNDEDITIVK